MAAVDSQFSQMANGAGFITLFGTFDSVTHAVSGMHVVNTGPTTDVHVLVTQLSDRTVLMDQTTTVPAGTTQIPNRFVPAGTITIDPRHGVVWPWDINANL